MPSCTPEVRRAVAALFPDADDLLTDCLNYLVASCGFEHDAGSIRSPAGHRVTEEEGACLDYVWQEWDYSYEGER